MSWLGVEVGARTLRAVRVRRAPRRVDVLELPWDPDAPTEAVAELRARLGPVAHLALAVETSGLFVKRVDLPPVSASEKRRMLALEPERYFPIRARDVVVAARDADNLVFAIDESRVEQWVEAFETLGRVEIVEPSPVALARAAARVGLMNAVVVRPLEGERGTEVTEVAEGRVIAARRIFGDLAAAAAAVREANGERPRIALVPWDERHASALRDALSNVTVERLPAVDGVAAPYLAAYGATLGRGSDRAASLAPRRHERRHAGRRRRQVLVAAGACAVALGFLTGALDRSRERALDSLDAQIAELRTRAAPLLALQREAEALSEEARALRDIERGRANPLAVLLAVTELLPPDTHLRSLWATGGDWQLGGYARDAAGLIPRFEADPRFEAVRFLAATTRVRRANETYEDFSLALRVVPAP